MQELGAEIAGTLARTSQRKNTILSKLHKQAELKRRAEKFGFATRPADPWRVSEEPSVRHFLNEVRGELAHLISTLHQPNLMSLERDGEVAVRQRNLQVNQLMEVRNTWIARWKEVGGALSVEDERIAKQYQSEGRRKRRRPTKADDDSKEEGDDDDRTTNRHSGAKLLFFGCAKQLPEALAASAAAEAAQRAREERLAQRQSSRAEEVEEDATGEEHPPVDDRSDDGADEEDIDAVAQEDEDGTEQHQWSLQGEDTLAHYLSGLQHANGNSNDDTALRQAEASAEEQFRSMHRHKTLSSSNSASEDHNALSKKEEEARGSSTTAHDDDMSFLWNSSLLVVPTDEEVKQQLFRQKKEKLLQRLAASRGN